MKSLIKNILVLCLMAGLTTPVLAKDWKKIRIGVEGAYPPFSQTEANGDVTGFDIDIANAICASIGAECEMVKQDWDGMIPALLSRRFDAIIASMSITEERKEKVNFSNKYYSSPATFVGKKGDKVYITKRSLKGKKIGVQGDTIMDRYVTDNYGDSAEIIRYGTQEEVNLDLKSGRLDLSFSEVGPADAFISSDDGKQFRYFGNFVSDPKWFGDGIGIAVRKEDDDLRKALNKAIRDIRKNGAYDEIQSKYFSYDIYGE